MYVLAIKIVNGLKQLEEVLFCFESNCLLFNYVAFSICLTFSYSQTTLEPNAPLKLRKTWQQKCSRQSSH